MKPLLCPNCHGDCCVNKRGSVVDHGSVLALHSCPDCPDGFAPANPLCPTCGGLCCRITPSLHTRVSHRSVTHTTHECDCLDGTAPAPDLAVARLDALLDAERENTALRAEVERLGNQRRLDNEDLARSFDMGWDAATAAVVAWLRGRQEAAEWALTAAGYEHAADAIERGEHRREEGA